VPPGQIGRLRASLGLLQKPDDLLFREPRSLPRPSSLKGQTLIDRGGKSGGHVKSVATPSSTAYKMESLSVMGCCRRKRS
jgi:hypothetical protein